MVCIGKTKYTVQAKEVQWIDFQISETASKINKLKEQEVKCFMLLLN